MNLSVVKSSSLSLLCLRSFAKSSLLGISLEPSFNGRAESRGTTLYGAVEVVQHQMSLDDLEEEVRERGFGLHGGLQGWLGDVLSYNLGAGYVDLDEMHGPQFRGEIGLRLAQGLGLFAEARLSDFTDRESDTTLEFRTLLLGLRVFY